MSFRDTQQKKAAQHEAGLVFHLIYKSENRILPHRNSVEFDHILSVARVNNALNGITGALLIYEGNFAQILEGDEIPVRTLMRKIKPDPRHGRLELLEEGATSGRVFKDWRMALIGFWLRRRGMARRQLMSVQDWQVRLEPATGEREIIRHHTLDEDDLDNQKN